ncbi:MAG: hypothetical protein K8W52_12790, partial [Deltaproteobacteria bacterium]|nr:hypothetical protein [Deltaproteobacteria bacterium]
VVANPVAGRWSDGKGGSTWPSLAVALQRSIAIAEPRVDGERGLMRFGIGAVLAPGGETVIGAVVIGDAVTEDDARAAARTSGAEVAFVDGEKVFASSARANPGDAAEIARSLAGATGDAPRAVTVAGRAYAAIAVPLPRMTDRGLVSELTPPSARAVLFAETPAPAPKP